MHKTTNEKKRRNNIQAIEQDKSRAKRVMTLMERSASIFKIPTGCTKGGEADAINKEKTVRRFTHETAGQNTKTY